jgi:hypothetical protein
MRRKIVYALCALAGTSLAAPGIGKAATLDFAINAAGSSEGATILSYSDDPQAVAALSPGLGSESFTLSPGQQVSFPFFTITVGGSGSLNATLSANLAFSLPVVGTISDTAQGYVSTYTLASQQIVTGSLNWAALPIYTLPNGSKVSVTFQNLDETLSAGQNQFTVDATVKYVSAVPLPSAVLLFAGGLAALGGVGWRINRRRNAGLAA